MPHYDYQIVGAGFAGIVCAQQMAAAGKSVLVVDKRNHIGGNAYDMLDEHGVLIHPYGPHIFHTNSKRVFEYLSQFTDWRFYEHRVLAEVDTELYPIPINRTTINGLYNLNLQTDEEVAAYLEGVRIKKEKISNSEDVVLNSVGEDLCDKFFRGYTKKQWALDLSELSAGVASRIPTRTDTDDRYFTDTYQFMPAAGYTAMFKRMLASPKITVQVSTDYKQLTADITWDHMIYTGPIDTYFNCRYGELPYRSLRFEHAHYSQMHQYQSVGTVNYPNNHAYTRITEFKHLTGQPHQGSSIVKEFPEASGDPFYPIPRPENQALYKKYQELAESADNVSFVGRLAEYKYFNMDQVVASALALSSKLLK